MSHSPGVWADSVVTRVRYPESMKRFPGEFLNVDLDLRSRADPAALVQALGSRVLTAHHGRSGGRHWLRFNLSAQPKTPTEAIRRFAKLINALPSSARRIWTAASKEMDIGIQAGFERGSGEWVLDARTVKTLADLETPVRVTIYSPLLLMHGKVTQTSLK